MIRITKLSNQALLEIILDLEVLVYHFPSFPSFLTTSSNPNVQVSRPLPLLHDTDSRTSMVVKAHRGIIKCPHTLTVSFFRRNLRQADEQEEQVYQVTFPNEQTALAAMNAMRPYFNIGATIPVNNAGVKRSRPTQSQSQVRRPPPTPQYPVPPMYDFGQSDIPPPVHPYQPSQAPIHHPYPTYPPTQGYPGLPTPTTSTAGVIIPPTLPMPPTSPPEPQTVHPALPILPNTAEPGRESSPPPLEESQSAETQFLETQYSAPKGSSSSSCDKPPNAQIQKSSQIIESDETLEDLPKRVTSTPAEGDLLSMDDEEISYSPGLAAHPALDPYEGMPWSSNMGQNGRDRDARPFVTFVM